MKYNQLAMLCGAACLLALLIPPAAGAELEGFVIPSVAFSHLRIEAGEWCEYMVVEESMGQQDSSLLYMSIPLTEEKADPGHFWFELRGQPLGGDEQEAVVVKLLLSDEIRRVSRRDSLGKYVAALYIKEGDEPVRKGDSGELSRLETAAVEDTSSWRKAGSEWVETRAGRFSCEVFERDAAYEKRIRAKGSTLIKNVVEHHRSWFAGEVPLFQMVRYTAERLRNTRMDPPLAGVPVAGARAFNTRVELIGFGTGARSLLPPGN